MLDTIRKSILAGIGAVALTEEKIQELVQSFIQKGEISESEGESLISDVGKAVDEQKAKISAIVNQQVKDLLNGLNLVTKTDLEETEKALKKDFAKVEKQLTKLEKQVHGPQGNA
jgi:polyhydroxyalkanoate synthesis regulator phasin